MLEENKTIMRRGMEEIVSGGDLDLIDELVSPDFVDHTPMPGRPSTREGLKQSIAELREAFPDIETEIGDLVSEGEHVVARYNITGTHQGAFMGVPPTGKEVAWSAMLMFRIADDKVTEQWLEQDWLGLMQQLGAAPPPAG